MFYRVVSEFLRLVVAIFQSKSSKRVKISQLTHSMLLGFSTPPETFNFFMFSGGVKKTFS